MTLRITLVIPLPPPLKMIELVLSWATPSRPRISALTWLNLRLDRLVNLPILDGEIVLLRSRLPQTPNVVSGAPSRRETLVTAPPKKCPLCRLPLVRVSRIVINVPMERNRWQSLFLWL